MSMDPDFSQNKSPVYSNSPMENYRNAGYRLPGPRKTVTFQKVEPLYVGIEQREMVNDFTNFQVQEVEEEEETVEQEEFDEAFLSEIEKSHRKMGKA